MFYFNIAVKSIIERKRQYKSLFAVCAVGVCLMLCAIMVTDGMISSMNEKARQYYGGDVLFLGGHSITKPLTDALEEAQMLKESVGDRKDVKVFLRYNHDPEEHGESYYYEGTTVRQRAIIGVDFENEKDLFDKFTFVEGTYHKGEYEDTVLISEPIAKKLGCHVGDSITYFAVTYNNYANTIDLVVTGIFLDASVFGMYTSYVNYDSLIKAIDYDPLVDRISLYYVNGKPSGKDIEKVHSEMSKKIQMYPLDMEKKDFYKDFRSSDTTKVRKGYLVSLDSTVSDLKLLVQALRLIVAAIVLLLVIIISVGISSTYRVIDIKRSLESGTLRAIGMMSSGIMKLFISEAFVLLLSGCFTGFVFSLIITKIGSVFDLSFISGFDLFLTGGHLDPHIDIVKIAAFISVIIVTTLLSVLFTLRKLVRVSPVGAITATT